MNRLTHSPKGYLRAMQMSRTQIFVFVEGQSSDRYFFGMICNSVCKAKGIAYEVQSLQDWAGTSGKDGLVSFYHFMQKRRSLIDVFKDKMTISIFFFDKDIDDILRKKCRSHHAIYTKYYEVENHIFVHGNIIRGAAAATSLDPQLIENGIGNAETWRSTVASVWKEWVKLCLAARKLDIRSGTNYGSKSQVNVSPLTPTNAQLFMARLNALQIDSGMPGTDFSQVFAKISAYVDKLYSKGEHDLVFKGKWYAALLEEQIRAIIGNRAINTNSLDTRLSNSIAATLDFDLPWAEHFKQPISDLIAIL